MSTGRRTHVLSLVTTVVLAVLTIVACQPAPQGGTNTPAATPRPTAPAMSPGVRVDGSVVTIVGVGSSKSDMFELPAGSATMRITACQSNQVMPFITLFDGNNQSVGLIVDPEKVLNNLAGGSYYVLAQTNPNCVWQVTITAQS
jgi:hypothetical protein